MSHQPHQDEPTIATGEYVPQERPEPKPGEATGEFLPEPETSGARTEALTGEFQPVEAPDATGEYLPESPLPQIDVDVGARTEALTGEFRPPEAPDAPDATGEYRPEASAGAAPAPDQTVDQDPPRGDATGEFISGHPRGGTIRGRGGDTGDKIGRGATADPYTSSPDQSRFSTLKRKPDSTQGGRAASSGSAPLQLSRYDMKTLAGKGGMGEVWLADDGAIGRPVAIKRMIKGRADQRDRFLMEAQITGQLEHPGVVPVHELGLDDNGQPYYVMKFVQGATLQKVINEYHDPKTPEADKEVQRLRLLSIFLNLCQTIAYSHSRKIIHRDIKPENVMTGAYGETLVLDWGLAKTIGAPEDATAEGAIRASGADTNATMMGAAKGTPTYFSPEAAAGLVHEVDQLSDIYLLGATLYHILTGKPPRHATKIRELIEMAKNTPPAPPRSIKPDVPKPLEAICMKAMAHDRKDRYRTATELAEDMQRYLAGEPVTAYKETFLERTWRWAKKHHKALGRGVAGLLVAAGALVAFLVIQDIQAKAEADRIADAKRIADATKKAEVEAEKAKLLARIDQTNKDMTTFRAKADDARFQAALADQMTDEAPVVDLRRAIDKGRQALEFAAVFGPDLDEIPGELDAKKPKLRQDIYELLLEQAQVTTRQPGAAPAKEALALLDRAAKFGAPTQSYHRLRAYCLRTLDQGDRGAADEKRVAAADVPTTALDHYLVAEELRRQSILPGKKDASKDDRTLEKKVIQPRQEPLLKAVDEYKRALTKDPQHYWSLFQLGSCYSGLGRMAEAVEALSGCVTLRPQAPWGYAARANAEAALHRFKEARDDIEKSLEIDKNFIQAILYRAMVSTVEKKYAEALKDLDTVLAAPEDRRIADAAFSRAQVYLKQDKYDEALADLTALGDTRIRTAYLHKARIYLAQKKKAPCLENLTAFLTGGRAVDPKDAEIHVDRAVELRKLASELPAWAGGSRAFAYQLIFEQLDAAIKKDLRSAKLYGELGAVSELDAGLRKTKEEVERRLTEAIAAYAKGIDYDPKDVKLRIKHGWANVNFTNVKDPLKGFKDARESFEGAVKLAPDNAEAHTGLGFTQAVLDSPADARRNANLAMLYGGGDYLILHNVACIFAVLSDKGGAKKEFQDLALDQLERAVALWEKGGGGQPNQINLMKAESAFSRELKARPEFQALIKRGK